MSITTTKRETFPKRSRLYLRSQVESLFTTGKSFKAYPYRVVFLLDKPPHSDDKPTSPYPYGCKVLISVAKKRFKRAVDRNRIKRITREAYRREPTRIALEERLIKAEASLSLALIVISSKIPTFQEANQAMAKLCSQLHKRLDNEIEGKE